jgi:glycosyltransferase involved in cell wall biosynthesis
MKKKYNNLVSIIINCHNGEKFVERCIKSVLKQSYKKFEVIFWDNKSSDNTYKKLQKLKDKRIRYFKSQNFTKLYHARNLALREARGYYVSFLDIDDTWERDKIKKQYYKLKKNNCDVCFTNHWIMTNIKKIFKSNLSSKNIFKQILNEYPISILTVMMKRNIFFKDKFFFDKKYEIIGDFDFFFRISKLKKFCCINEPLATYYIHDNNLSKKKINTEIREFSTWINKNKSILNKYSNKIILKNNIRKCNYLLSQNKLAIFSKEIKSLVNINLKLKFLIKIVLKKINLI